MTDLFHAISLLAGGDARMGALHHQSRLSRFLLPFISMASSASVLFRSVSFVIVGLMQEVLWDPMSEIPTEIYQLLQPPPNRVNASRHNSRWQVLSRRSYKDDELPCHESSKMFFGAASTSAPPYKAIFARRRQHSHPPHSVGPAYAQSVKLCFWVGWSHPLDFWLPASCATWVAIP